MSTTKTTEKVMDAEEFIENHPEGWSRMFFRKEISWLQRENCSGKTRGRRPLFFLEDNTGAKIGYTYQDGEDQVLIDLKGNIFRVSRKTSIKQATRILLKHLQEA